MSAPRGWISAADPTADAELIEASRARLASHLSDADRRAALLLGGAFLVVALAMVVLIGSSRQPSLLTIAALVAAYAVTSRVEFEVGTGGVVPTQLLLVPMLFLLPIGAVPLFVALGLVLGRSPALFRRRSPPDRLLLLLVNSWHSVGPALVLGVAGESSPAWSHWPLYLGALAAQFACDEASSGTRDWLALGLPWRLQLSFIRWAFVVDAALSPIALAVVLSGVRPALLPLVVLPLVGLLALFARERQTRLSQALELDQAYVRTAFLLGDVVESSDAYTGRHSRQVVSLSVDVADRLGLTRHEQRLTELAALLHDVGKLRIPPEIINKRGPLSEAERELVQTHTVEGEQILRRLGGLLAQVALVVRSSHERFDGRGYPDGLAGESIPVTARVVACCDALSAMVTDRPYRKALGLDVAIAELHAHAGTQFDPRVVESLDAAVAANPQAAALLAADERPAWAGVGPAA